MRKTDEESEQTEGQAGVRKTDEESEQTEGQAGVRKTDEESEQTEGQAVGEEDRRGERTDRRTGGG